MARPKEEKIEGYITHLTPVKTSQNNKTKYFTAKLQMEKQLSRKIVCFSPEKYAGFKTASESPEAFRLLNAKVQPGRNNEVEIKVFKHTDLVVTKKLDFTKTYTNTNKEEEKQKTFKLIELNEDFQIATVNVKYLEVIEKEKPILTKYGPRSITTAIVADDTDTMKLVIWSNDLVTQLHAGECYCISFLRLKMFEKGQLNTTSDTTITAIPALQNVKSDIKEIYEEQEMQVQFQSVQVNKKVSCSVCFNLFTADEYIHPLVRCSNCNFKVLTNALPPQISVSAYVQIDGEQKKLQIPPESVESLLTAEHKTELKDDPDALEDFLILNKFLISLSNESVVTKIRKC